MARHRRWFYGRDAVLEWAVGFPSRLDRAVVLAVGATSTAHEIALSSLQIRAIRLDPLYREGDYYDTGSGPFEGMALARGIGHFTYRSADEFDVRFGRQDQEGEVALDGGRYAVESYLQYHGDKLVDVSTPIATSS